MSNPGLLSTPLLEVLSVRVNARDVELFECVTEIYGTITVTNGLGHTFDLYNRKRDKPESVTLITMDEKSYSGLLSLSGPPKDNVIIPYECVTVNMDLRDKARGDIVIARGVTDIFSYKVNSLSTEEYGHKSVPGKGGFAATLRYATFPYAVKAYVDVLFFTKNDDFDLLDKDDGIAYDDYANYQDGLCDNDVVVADVCGNVTVAHKASSSELLNMRNYQCARVKSRDFIELSRSTVAVSVYSPLQIYVDFKYIDGSGLADGVLEFHPYHCGMNKKDIVGNNGRIRVRVRWNNAYEQRYMGRGSDLKRTLIEYEASSSQGEEGKIEELVKRQRLHVDAQPLSGSSDWLPPPPVPKRIQHWWERVPLVELFSVRIRSNDLKPPFKLFGKIHAVGGCFIDVFKRDERSPQICSDKLELDFTFPWCLAAPDDFGMQIDLNDVEGKISVCGIVAWGPCRLGHPWYDKRICSLIRGVRGYAALHYSIFYDGVQARVEVLVQRINTGLNLTTKISGNLVARYSSHEYLTPYDKEYYQSVLFDSEAEDPVEVKEDGSLPLSKLMVSVPRMSSLIIEANLIVGDDLLPQPSVGGEALQGIVEFNADNGESSKEIWGQHYWTKVLVTWPKY